MKLSEVEALIDEYWNLAYAEGQRGATTDTPDGDAQRVRSALSATIERLLAERDEAVAHGQIARGQLDYLTRSNAANFDRAAAAEAQRDKLKEALEATGAAITGATFPAGHPIWDAAKLARQALGETP